MFSTELAYSNLRHTAAHQLALDTFSSAWGVRAQVFSTELAGFRREGCRLLRRVLPATEEEARRIWAFCPVAEGA